MEKINLDKMPEMHFSFEGRDYTLRCNLSVFEAVSKQCGEKLMSLFEGNNALDGSLIFLAAMLNDYAEDQDWPDFVPYTAKQLKKKVSPHDRGFLEDVINLVFKSAIGKSLDEIPSPADQGAESTD